MGKLKNILLELEEQNFVGDDCYLPPDMINHPSHYTQGGIECITAIKAALTPEEFRGYCKGNSMKYIWRERHKGGRESLMKAAWYLKELENASNPF